METETERPTSLWHHPNFLKLWTSDTISQFGTQFSGYAIPFTALLLTSDPLAFSILNASAFIGFAVFALFIGVYVDRHRRQRIMTLANIGRGIFLGLIPLAAVTGTLTRAGMPLLYVVSFMVGLLTVFFDVSYQAILPSLVDRSQLVEGNSKLEWSRSGAQVVGTIFLIGGLGAFGGIALSSRLTRLFGVGPVIIAGMILGGLGTIPYALANSSLSAPIFSATGIPVLGSFRLDLNALILMMGGFVTSIGVVVYNINQVSLRQAIVPKSIQGRMNASMRWIVWCTIPAGAITGGVLAEVFGLREAIVIGVIGGIFPFLWVFLSPVRSLKHVPEPME